MAAPRIVDIDVSDEVRSSFLEYAYSVIYARALPDARDGLKPVQRRILFQMAAMGLRPDRGHVKSARVVGEVMGRLHPHGDSAIYDALVRLAQPFTMRTPMVDGHGNFGSPDDGPAAMRYTEARLSAAGLAMTADISEDTVDFTANYDGREMEPEVLPAAWPSLLVNGASGIAVGMATNLVPHNLVEVVAGAIALLEKPKASLNDIMARIPGPDYPSGGVIVGLDGIREAYETGRGTFRIRARTRVEQVSARRQGIVVTELPHTIGPERVIERIKELVQAKKLSGIYDVVDLSDGETGLRLIIELKSGIDADALQEQLFKLTPLEDTVSVNAVALVDGQPQTLGLLDLLRVFLDHRLTVTRRRSAHRLSVATERLHLVDGLLIAIVDIDEVIALIRASDDTASARTGLLTVFDLTQVQADYILEMPLRRLTKFSRIELEAEADELRRTMAGLQELLEDDGALRSVVAEELRAAAQVHGTARRTLLADAVGQAAETTPIDPDEPSIVMLSSTGLLARARDITAHGDRATHDVLPSIAAVTTEVALVTNTGRMLRLDVRDIPTVPAMSLAAGAPIGALATLDPGEQVIAVAPVDAELVLITAQGRVKRVQAEAPSHRSAWSVISLAEGDTIIAAVGVNEKQAEQAEVVLITSDAQLLRFPAAAVRAQGRGASGVSGITLARHASVIAGSVVADVRDALVATIAGSSTALPGTDAGSAKVTPLSEFPAKGRGTKGVRCHKFRSGEDILQLAAVGPGPIRAASASGTPLDLPQTHGKRDGVGSPLPIAVGGVAASW